MPILKKTVLTLGAALQFVVAPAGAVETSPAAVALAATGVTAVDGPLIYVACTTEDQLNVRDDSLSNVIFTVHRFEVVKPVQSFGVDAREQIIDGQTFKFVKVQFPENSASQNVGWVAEHFVKIQSQCAGASVTSPPSKVASSGGWTFPTIKRPSDSYKTGQRAFRANRSGGRLHAATDLYRVTNEAAVAINSGTVVRDRYYFYEGTYAIEVKHTGGKIARYGEITGKAATGVGLNKTVKAGQTVGYVGKVNSGCCAPMLHFEMYAGTATGALTQSGNAFSRRKDLIDPTALLVEWEKAKFGTSY